MDHDKQADEIRKAMAQVRRDVEANTQEVLDHARELSDWRYYVRKYPKLSLATAAAIGFLIVPAKRKSSLAGQYAATLAANTGNAEAVRKPSLKEQLLSTAARLVIRNGMPLIASGAIHLWQQRNGRPMAPDPSSMVETPNAPFNQT